MPVQERVLEAVPVAAQAAVAGRVAAGGAVLQPLQGLLEDLQAGLADLLREARAARQRVVQVDLGLQPGVPVGRQRRPVLRLQFGGLDVEVVARRRW